MKKLIALLLSMLLMVAVFAPSVAEDRDQAQLRRFRTGEDQL